MIFLLFFLASRAIVLLESGSGKETRPNLRDNTVVNALRTPCGNPIPSALCQWLVLLMGLNLILADKE